MVTDGQNNLNTRSFLDGVIDSKVVLTCKIGLVLDGSLGAQCNGFSFACGCRVPDSTDLRLLARLNANTQAWRSRRPSLEFDSSIPTPHMESRCAGFQG